MKHKSRYGGTGKVFSFTLHQMLCTKANIIGMISVFVIMLISGPVSAFMNGSLGGSDSDVSEVSAIHWYNETGLDLDLEDAVASSSWLSDTYWIEEDSSSATQEIYETVYPDQINLVLSGSRSSYQLTIYYSEDTEVEDGTTETVLMDLVQKSIQNALFAEAGTDSDALTVLQKSVSTEVLTEKDVEETTDVSWDARYFGQLYYSILIMMLSIYVVSFIAQSLAEEKSNKLVEYLLVSVKPAALVLGKVFACMVYVTLLMIVILCGMLISQLFTRNVLHVAGGISFGEFSLSSIDPVGGVVIVVSLILGYVAYALLGGIFGATSNGPEDTSKAIAGPMVIIMVGYVAGLVFSGVGSRTLSVIGAVIPFLNIFTAAPAFLAGTLTLPMLFVSWGVQILVILLISWFGGRVYESLIMHRGGKVGFLQLLGMAGQKKTERGETR